MSGIALDSGINANLLFKWRREYLRAARDAATATPTSKPVLLPVTVEAPMPQMATAPTSSPPVSRTDSGSIEIDIAGARIRLRGAVDESSVRVVLQALRGLE